MSFIAKKVADYTNEKWKQMCIDKIEMGDLKCEDLVVQRAQKDVAKNFNPPSDDIIKECAQKIIKAICSAIQSDKIKSITSDVKDKLIKFLTDLKPSDKELIAKYILDEPDDTTEKKEEKNNISEITYADREPAIELISPGSIDEYSKLKDGATMIKYYTEILCDCIKKNPGLLDVFIGSLYRRFEKYIRDNNNKQEILLEILDPIAKETRKILKSKTSPDEVTEQTTGGNPRAKSQKTKLYKKLLKRERTLKRRIFSR